MSNRSDYICCATNLQLDSPAESFDCQFGSLSVPGICQNNDVICIPPQDTIQTADVEREGLRCRVVGKSDDKIVYESEETVARPATQQPTNATDSNEASTTAPTAPPKHGRFMRLMTKRYGALLPFVIISCSYLLFTITDGAVRMIVLLHAYQKGFTAMQVAIMFSFYELAGVVTNLAAGMLGARWGLKTTLLTGLTIQLAGIGMLYGWQSDWSKTEAIIYVTASQVLCGVAKDLTKLGGKTVTKLVTPEGKDSKLFKLVSFITGFKNSLKGLGYFLGALTVSVSYYLSLSILLGLVLLAMPWAIIGLSNDLGRARKENVTFKQLFNAPHNVNILSLSRVFLFGSRDLWFEVPLPFFLRSPESGIGWSRPLTGAFLAIFIIVYGQVQSWTPQLALTPLRQSPPDKYVATLWCATLAVPISILGGIMLGTDVFTPAADSAGAIAAITILLYTFCILFAVNSAVHSYLIVRYAEGNKVAMQVGVYYASNAAGRLTGTLASGALYTYVGNTVADGMGACLFTSVVFIALSTVIDVFLHEDSQGASWLTPFNRCLPGVVAPPSTIKTKDKKKGESGGDSNAVVVDGSEGVAVMEAPVDVDITTTTTS